MKYVALTLMLLSLAGNATAQTDAELRADGTKAGNTDNVLTYGMGYHQNRYSPLNKINKNNVKRLVPVWSTSLDNELGEQAQPLLYEGVMYISNARWTYAIDALTGKVIWRTAVNFDPDTPRVVCCGNSNKGVAIYNGKVFRTTLDAFVIALDQKTGKEVWRQKVAEWKEGYSLTVAPQIANGVVITGCSGAEFGARCFLDGWDPAKNCGVATPPPAPAKKATIPGSRARRICMAVPPPGLPARMTRSLISRTGVPVTQARGMTPSARGTICMSHPCSRSAPRPAKSCGTTSLRPMMSGIGTRGK